MTTVAQPRWLDYVINFFLFGFAFQKKHTVQAPVIQRRHRTEKSSPQTPVGFPLSQTTVNTEEAWLLKVRTPHGPTEIEVSEKVFLQTRKGDEVGVKYQLHHLYSQNRELKASLL